ncbi:hypothetical protein [Spirulina sp. CCNP1310]|nr:hypothetical protein [Spirulina sp. CCNP1310]
MLYYLRNFPQDGQGAKGINPIEIAPDQREDRQGGDRNVNEF